jgi:hypothetical protein
MVGTIHRRSFAKKLLGNHCNPVILSNMPLKSFRKFMYDKIKIVGTADALAAA